VATKGQFFLFLYLDSVLFFFVFFRSDLWIASKKRNKENKETKKQRNKETKKQRKKVQIK
jgi:hypothetical protein